MICLQRILVPTDFSEHSRHALRYGIALAEKFGAELHLLHVFQDVAVYQPDAVTVGPPMVPPVEALTAAARAALNALVQDHHLEHLQVHAEVREGPPVLEIVDYALEHQVDLIVIATHGRGWLAHFLLGSVAEKVVRKAPCPVMAVHLPEHEFVVPWGEEDDKD
jgi:universal stress protein A